MTSEASSSDAYKVASGIAEGATVYSLVASIIDIIKPAVEIYEAIKDKSRLPEKLRIVAEKLPSIEQLLASSKQQYRQHKLSEATWTGAKDNVQRCKDRCAEIRDIFEKAFPQKANVVHRVWTGTVTVLSGKGERAEELQQEVYEELEVLSQHHIITNTEVLAEIKAAVDQIRLHDTAAYHHYGSGSLSVNSGSGTQHVKTNSGAGNRFEGQVHSPAFHSGTK